MSHLTSTFKGPKIYMLIHLSYLNLIFCSAVPIRYLSQSTKYLSQYMGAAALFCTILGKHRTLFYHTVSKLEKKTSDWQNCRQNSPGSLPTLPSPIKHGAQPLQRHVILRAVPGKKPLGSSLCWIAAPQSTAATHRG